MNTLNNVHYIRKDNLTDGSLDIIHNCVFALGNFDGVHKGHIALLQKAAEKAKDTGLPNNWGVIIFNPHPKEFLYNTEKFLLTYIETKILNLIKVGVPKILILDFPDFYQLAPEDFLNLVLLNGLKAKGLVVGCDFKFGKDRVGNVQLLEEFGLSNNIQVTILNKVKVGDKICSSSTIRDLIKLGQIEEANQLLGRDFEIQGTVIRGNSLARTLGYPTANVILHNSIVEPKYGVYIVKTKVDQHKDVYLPSIANFGLRPTFHNDNNKKAILEVHILNNNINLYNQNIMVKFLKYVRSETKFLSIEDLKSQLDKDVNCAKEYFI